MYFRQYAYFETLPYKWLLTAKRWNIDMVLVLDTNMKSHTWGVQLHH